MNFLNIGVAYFNKVRYDAALDYFNKSLVIDKEIGDKHKIGLSLYNIGTVYLNKGEFNIALDYFGRSLIIREELGDNSGIGDTLNNIGFLQYNNGDYNKAIETLEKYEYIFRKENGEDYERSLLNISYLYLSCKKLGKEFDEKEIHTLIKEAENIEFNLNYYLYELLEDKSYLETAYNQIQEKADAMDDELKEKF